MISEEDVYCGFKEFAEEKIRPNVESFSELMFVEWEGNERARLEALGFYAGSCFGYLKALEEVRNLCLIETSITTDDIDRLIEQAKT